MYMIQQCLTPLTIDRSNNDTSKIESYHKDMSKWPTHFNYQLLNSWNAIRLYSQPFSFVLLNYSPILASFSLLKFAKYMNEQRVNGTDVDVWSMDDLTIAVEEFIRQQDLEKVSQNLSDSMLDMSNPIDDSSLTIDKAQSVGKI